MAVGYLNERTQKVINKAVKRSSTFTIKEVAAELSVSTRTVYNELEKANDWLRGKKLPEIQIVRGKICPFSEEDRELLTELEKEEQKETEYIFTPSERIRIIVCQIIVSGEPIYVENLMNSCQVSRNTIFADLKEVAKKLKKYDLDDVIKKNIRKRYNTTLKIKSNIISIIGEVEYEKLEEKWRAK